MDYEVDGWNNGSNNAFAYADTNLTVATASTNTIYDYVAGSWVGLGNNDILQAGTVAAAPHRVADGTDLQQYCIFVEALPDAAQESTTPAISPGDSVFVSVDHFGADRLVAYWQNLRTQIGASWTVGIGPNTNHPSTSTGPRSTAEFVLEEAYNLPYVFGSIAFTSAYAETPTHYAGDLDTGAWTSTADNVMFGGYPYSQVTHLSGLGDFTVSAQNTVQH